MSSDLTPEQLQLLSDEIEAIDLTGVSADSRTLCICAYLNRPVPQPAVEEVREQLKPVDLLTLVNEELLTAEQLKQATEHPLTSGLVQVLVQQGGGAATEVNQSIAALVRAALVAAIATEEELQACLDRLDLETVKAADAGLPEGERRYVVEKVEVAPPAVSWAQANLGRAVEGVDVEAALA